MENFKSVLEEYMEERPSKFIQEDDITMKKNGGVIKKIISEGMVD